MFGSACGLAGCGGSQRREASGTRSTPTVTATATAPTVTAPASSTARPTPAPASDLVTYGLGDAPGRFAACRSGVANCCDASAGSCDLTRMTGYFDDPLFLKLITPSSAHQLHDVRLFVPYDAVSAWNGSTTSPGCTYSDVIEHSWTDAEGLQPAGEAIGQLLAGVIEARADGLDPMVTITGYPFPGLRPAGDAPTPDPTTTGGYWAYRCGLQGILGELSRLPGWEQPHVWEAENEPQAFAIFRGDPAAPATQCDVGSAPQPDGAGKAACDEAIATEEIHGFAGHAADTVIAGTFEYPDAAYLAPYTAELARLMPGTRFPATWSVHDYREVTNAYLGGGATGLAQFDEALAADSGGRARSLWITEAGTNLTSHARGAGCPASGVDAAGSLGACVNGQLPRQLAAADAFFALPHAAAAVPITHLFWYQFAGAAQWDSGLVDPAGQPREPYCIFYGSGSCPGDPNAA